MGFLLLFLGFIALIFMFSGGCGIKKPPKPPPYPEFQVKRIGDLVYVITADENVVVEGFEKGRGFWFTRREEKFCFKVSHRRGKTVLRCVGASPRGRPRVQVDLREDRVLIRAKGFGLYRIYPVGETLIPVQVAEFRDTLILKRERRTRRFGITGVLRNAETEPVLVEVPPLEPPAPEPPEDLSYTVRGNRIILFWRGGEGLRYLVYRNGSLVTREPIRANVFVDRLPTSETVYEVVAINRFGKRSEPAVILYRP
jgi:hypothetical protein